MLLRSLLPGRADRTFLSLATPYRYVKTYICPYKVSPKHTLSASISSGRCLASATRLRP